MPTNNFSSNSLSVLSPFTSASAVTLNDSTDLAEVTRGIVCHSSGTTQHVQVSVIFMNDSTPVTVACRTGIAMPFRVKRVRSTGTDAGTSVVALY